MGFLNHSTNNVIVDAVLTEKGRELLSRNDRSFEISSFRFSDDDVDYSLITKYGHIIGKEKIEKNTPVFEALTGEDTSLKYPLLNLASVTKLTHMPTIVDINSSIYPFYEVSSNTKNTNSTRTINVKTQISGVDSSFILTDALIDDSFFIVMNRNLLRLNNVNVRHTSKDDIVSYKVNTKSDDTNQAFVGQRYSEFGIQVSGNFTNDMYTLYGTSDNIIKTEIKVIGSKSSSCLILPVEISLN